MLYLENSGQKRATTCWFNKNIQVKTSNQNSPRCIGTVDWNSSPLNIYRCHLISHSFLKTGKNSELESISLQNKYSEYRTFKIAVVNILILPEKNMDQNMDEETQSFERKYPKISPSQSDHYEEEKGFVTSNKYSQDYLIQILWYPCLLVSQGKSSIRMNRLKWLTLYPSLD